MPGEGSPKSSFREGIAVNLEAWGWGGGAAVGKGCAQQGPGGWGWRFVCSAMLAPFHWPPAPSQVPRALGTSGRTLVCLKPSQPPFLETALLHPPLGVCTDSGALQARCAEWRPPPPPRALGLFLLGPHVRSLFACSCQMSALFLLGRGASGRPPPGMRAQPRARPKQAFSPQTDGCPPASRLHAPPPKGPALGQRALDLGLLGPPWPLEPPAPSLGHISKVRLTHTPALLPPEGVRSRRLSPRRPC